MLLRQLLACLAIRITWRTSQSFVTYPCLTCLGSVERTWSRSTPSSALAMSINEHRASDEYAGADIMLSNHKPADYPNIMCPSIYLHFIHHQSRSDLQYIWNNHCRTWLDSGSRSRTNWALPVHNYRNYTLGQLIVISLPQNHSRPVSTANGQPSSTSPFSGSFAKSVHAVRVFSPNSSCSGESGIPVRNALVPNT